MSELYVDLAIPATIDKLFTYSVPSELRETVQLGIRVTAPFGKRTVIGFVVARTTVKPNIPNLRKIQDVLDFEPLLSEELLNLTKWIAEYYFASLGDVIKSALVQGAMRPNKRIVKLNRDLIENENIRATLHQSAILAVLKEHGSSSIQQLQKRSGVKNIHSVLRALVANGIITIDDESYTPNIKPKFETFIEITEQWKTTWRQWLNELRSQKSTSRITKHISLAEALGSQKKSLSVKEFLTKHHVSLSILRTLERNHLLEITKREAYRTNEFEIYESSLGNRDIILNKYQIAALETLRGSINAGKFQTYLLHGITGSGKTQVYIEAIRETLANGKTAIVLVPEISLTPQIVRRFMFHFGNKVVSLHSRMSLGERYDAWRRIHEGKYSIVIGPRSAIFAPLKNLGLIVVDEEHETSFKQFDQSPRYHARDVAIMRAHFSNAVVVLGSATPSLESYTNTLNGKYLLLELPERVDNAQLPQIDIVDMVRERKEKLSAFREKRKAQFKEDAAKAKADTRKLSFGLISDLLKEKITHRLAKKEGIILLQNRRGFAPITECPDCGHVEMCDNCSIALTYHLTKKHLRCHYCGFVKRPPDECPDCKSHEISHRGFGTQRVEEELLQLFPHVNLLRMDLDTTTGRGSHDAILRKFSEGKADILLGTQMVAKGLDFSRVTLVGVISADTQMLLPDFRSAERTFQLLTQVAGRAGRSTLPGEVVIQTFQSNHYALKHVLDHNFTSYYKEELSYRQELNYPPYSRMVLIECKGKREEEVIKHLSALATLLKKKNTSFLLLGPAAAAVTKLKGEYRWHIILKDLKSKDPSGHQLHRALKSALVAYTISTLGKSRSASIVIDVDPAGMV
jgi:primosomal protein N' (replication factor Y)